MNYSGGLNWEPNSKDILNLIVLRLHFKLSSGLQVQIHLQGFHGKNRGVLVEVWCLLGKSRKDLTKVANMPL